MRHEPIKLWRLPKAPKRYRDLLSAERAAGRLHEEEYPEYVWVAAMVPELAATFWGPSWDRASAPASLAQQTRAGVRFHRAELDGRAVFFFTDNDGALEIAAGG